MVIAKYRGELSIAVPRLPPPRIGTSDCLNNLRGRPRQRILGMSFFDVYYCEWRQAILMNGSEPPLQLS